MFGDFDDDVFGEERTSKTTAEPVVLLRREPEWFFNETDNSDHHEKWLALKFTADRFYRRREFEAAGDAYVKAIKACPNRNLGLLRDCVDGAARSYFRSGPKFLAESQKYLNELDSMVTCEDHKFSHATTALLMSGDAGALRTLLESEPQACQLWKKLGDVYAGEGKILYALCCFLKSSSAAKCCAYESKDRFREQNSLLSKEMGSKIEEMASHFGEHVAVVRRIQQYFSSHAELKKEPHQYFEEFWFPSEEYVLKEDTSTDPE